MSFDMQEFPSRRSSGSPKPDETGHDEESYPRDTAGLTGYPETATSTRKQSSSAGTSTGTWTLEILGWLLGLVSLIIILVLLGEFNNHPLKNWHTSLRFNTFISGVSQVAQTALFVPVAASISQLKWIWYSKSRPVGELEVFDKASRGPMYSLWLIVKHPKWVLVYLGALNTILILLFGLFAQQSVSLPLKQVYLPSSGSAPFSQQYQIYSETETLPEEGDEPTLGFSTVPPTMVSAVTDGLFTQGSISPSAVLASCETGNCTFPDYTSLAVCSAAEDVTPLIVQQGRCRTQAGCSLTLKPLQEAPTPRNDNFTVDEKGFESLWIGASENQGLNASHDPTLVQYGASPANLVEFYILFFPNVTVFSPDSTANIGASLVALRITLSLCLKTYRTNVTNGVTVTTVTDAQQALNFTEQTPAQKKTDSTVIATDSGGTQYWMEAPTANAFNSFLSTATFYGTYSSFADPNERADATSDAARAFGDILYKNNSPADHVAAIQPLLTNLDTSMSNAMRTTSDYPSNVSGTASYEEVRIEVDFRWLIGPILSVALALIFLVGVMVQTRKSQVPIWKDGLNNAVFALEPETRARMEGLMGGAAGGAGGKGSEDTRVVLEREGGNGWWLRGSGDNWPTGGNKLS